MSFARRRIFRGRLLLGLFGFLMVAAASFLVTRANFANAALAELNPDDWKMELVFFDDAVDDGRQPLTNVQWRIEDSVPGDDFSKIITMQINYRNENVDRTYEPGELEIVVKNPLYEQLGYYFGGETGEYQSQIGANQNGTSGFDWTFSGHITSEKYKFKNAVPFEINANVEGSIQVTYSLTTKGIANKYDDVHEKHYDMTDIVATMNGNVRSNTAELHYYRLTRHAWNRATYYITKQAQKIKSYNNLTGDLDNYTWVEYVVGGGSNEKVMAGYDYSYLRGLMYSEEDYDHDGVRYIGLKHDHEDGRDDPLFSILDTFPSDVLVFDKYGNEITHTENQPINIPAVVDVEYAGGDSCEQCYHFIAGYPKDKYNDALGTSKITNSVKLVGTYADRNEEEELANDEITIDLDDFEFIYQPGRTSLTKKLCPSSSIGGCTYGGSYYYEEMQGIEGSTRDFQISFKTDYDGTMYDLHLSDDVLYYADANGEKGILSDENYKFISVFLQNGMFGTSGENISDKYEMELYVRRRGSTEYAYYKDLPSWGSIIKFDDNENIQGWKLIIKDVKEEIYSAPIVTRVNIHKNNISENGRIYNFAYLRMMSGDTELLPVTIDSYASGITRDVIADYDIEHYGSYNRRALATASWAPNTITNVSHSINAINNNSKQPEYNASDEKFRGSFLIYGQFSSSSSTAFSDNYLNGLYLPDDDWLKTIYYYDLLPVGMEVDASESEIKNSIASNYCSNISWQTKVYGKDGRYLFEDGVNCADFMRDRAIVAVTTNWHNTGRTHVAVIIDLSDTPITNFSKSKPWQFLPSIIIPYSVSIDSYVENGRTYTNRAYVGANLPNHGCSNGSEIDSLDIDDDGNLSEKMCYSEATITLLSATSSRQDIQTSVLTNHNGKYDIDPALSGYGEDYSYKLRIRTGPNRVTNLVLYEHLEEEYGTNEHWQGNFNGINIDYAETRTDNYGNPVKIKVYWSENSDAGSIKTDSSWQEYDENTTDKTKVRSIAFEYLDQEGEPAILPQAFYTYVIVNMKAPDGDNILTLAYNNSHSEWNAIDNITGELIYNITGIDSNVVTVFLTEKFDLTVKKEWSDYDNAYDIRPDTVTFNLYKENELIDTKMLDVANGDTQVVFNDLQTAEQNSYRLEELAVEDYTASYDKDVATQTITVTNTIDYDDPNSEPSPFTGVIIKNTAIFIGLIVMAVIGGGVVALNRRS